MNGKPLSPPFQHLEGHCWFVELAGKKALDPRDVVVVEEGIRLAGAGSSLGVIKQLGFGAYRFCEEGLYFSSSDNSDPNHNGRRYRLVWNPSNVFVNYIPVNQRYGKMTVAQLEQRVQRAIEVFSFIDPYEQISGTTLNGKDVLEIGPGCDYAWALVMACLGANCSVVDPFVPVWSDEYHPQFFKALSKRLHTLPRIVTVAPIERLLEERDIKSSGLTFFADTAEELKAPSNTYDFVLSVSVGEHFYDIQAAFRELARVTRTGGYGFHSIDLRDHRDFSRPLEYLLVSDADFWKEFVLRHAECGNRHRANEFLDAFRQSGFEVVTNEAIGSFDARYLEDFIPRLRKDGHDRYRLHSVSDLLPLGMMVKMRKRIV